MAADIDVARVVLPVVSIGDKHHLMPLALQCLREGAMEVAIFTNEKDFHNS